MKVPEKEMILDSSMVEHSAVNRVVVGSSPTRGAHGMEKHRCGKNTGAEAFQKRQRSCFKKKKE